MLAIFFWKYPNRIEISDERKTSKQNRLSGWAFITLKTGTEPLSESKLASVSKIEDWLKCLAEDDSDDFDDQDDDIPRHLSHDKFIESFGAVKMDLKVSAIEKAKYVGWQTRDNLWAHAKKKTRGYDSSTTAYIKMPVLQEEPQLTLPTMKDTQKVEDYWRPLPSQIKCDTQVRFMDQLLAAGTGVGHMIVGFYGYVVNGKTWAEMDTKTATRPEARLDPDARYAEQINLTNQLLGQEQLEDFLVEVYFYVEEDGSWRIVNFLEEFRQTWKAVRARVHRITDEKEKADLVKRRRRKNSSRW